MRATLCRLAKPVVNTRTEAKFLTAGAPTGLTGLLTHPSPRPTLLVLYKKTRSRLQTLPESSSYRASATALTQHRLSIVEKIIPAGYEEWKVKAQAILEEHEGILDDTNEFDGHEIDGEILVTQNLIEEVDELEQSWDGETGGPELEGTRMPSERNFEIMGDKKHFAGLIRKREGVKWDPEPGLDSAQISEIEDKIGAGLIEEVIEVAEGELALVDTMIESKAWEELAEKPSPGQWEYFARKPSGDSPL